jgi:hypothetical protein
MGGFKPHPNAKKRVESAKRAIQAILEIRSELCPEHVRAILYRGLSLITEAEATEKYGLRYQTKKAIQAKSKKELRHEHVYEKKKLRDALLKHPEKFDEILEQAIGGVITEDEHKTLTKKSRENPKLDGWERYKAADLMESVIDGMIEAAKQLSKEELTELVDRLGGRD